MGNYIFLDIDGVLNDNIDFFKAECINVLKKLINKYDAKIVLISSLQGNGTTNRRNKLKNIFNEININIYDFIDPNFNGRIGDKILSSRVLGIVDYLKKNNILNYVIIDDEYHKNYKMLHLNYYKTNQYLGLKQADLNKILLKSPNFNILNRIDYKYRKLGEYELATNKLIKVLSKI